jgi:hypothetical protein
MVLLVGAAFALGVVRPTAAHAAGPTPTPTPTPTGGAAAVAPRIGPATPGTAMCTIGDSGLTEITGMVATTQGIYVVQGGSRQRPQSVVVWTVNPSTCAATSHDYGFLPIDPQDLATGSDGALWIADIGQGVGPDNQRIRLALERVMIGSSDPAVPYRVLYPPEGKFQAEAMLLDAHDQPIIIAQQSGKGVLYAATQPLAPNTETKLPTLQKVGEFVPAATGTPNPQGAAGQSLVTGAARSPDGSRVVIRTASDAYEFIVGADGDIIKAITSGTPLITPLPNEERGAAITYSADGSTFLTLSAVSRPVLRSYKPYRPATPTATAQATTPVTSTASAASHSSTGGGFNSGRRTQLLAAAGALVLAIIAILILRRGRRRRVEEDDEDDDDYGGVGRHRMRPARHVRGDDPRARTRTKRPEPSGYAEGTWPPDQGGAPDPYDPNYDSSASPEPHPVQSYPDSYPDRSPGRYAHNDERRWSGDDLDP